MANERGLGSKIGFALLGIFLALLAFFLFAVGAFAMGTGGVGAGWLFSLLHSYCL